MFNSRIVLSLMLLLGLSLSACQQKKAETAAAQPAAEQAMAADHAMAGDHAMPQEGEAAAADGAAAPVQQQ